MNYEEEDFVNCTFGRIKVVWNFQRYPLDVTVIPQIYDNIKSVLEEKHLFFGRMDIMAYGVQQEDYKHYEFYFNNCEYFPDDTSMTLDILYLTRDNPHYPSDRINIALITKKNEVDSELFRILNALASRKNHTVFLVEPPGEDKPFDFNDAQVLDERSRPQCISSSDDFIENFSLPLPPISEHNTGVFWDAKDYPFPDGIRDPDLVYDKIVRGLNNRGVYGKMTIWAYVDETEEYWNDKLDSKTWKASIYFLPRVEGRLFHDVLLWIKDNPQTFTPIEWSIVILNEPRTCDEAVWGWLRDFNPWCRRFHPLNYVVFRMKLSLVLESESESESEQGSSKRAKLVCGGGSGLPRSVAILEPADKMTECSQHVLGEREVVSQNTIERDSEDIRVMLEKPNISL